MSLQGAMILTPEDAALLVRSLGSDHVYAIGGALADLYERLRGCAALVPPPLNGDKVWYGLTTGLHRTGKFHNQSETVVRARSKAEAVRLLNAAGEYVSAGCFTRYWGVTGNRESLCAAKERGVYVKGPEGWIKK